MTGHDEIAGMAAGEMARRVRAKSLSPVEIVDATLAKIERLPKRLNPFVVLDGERARSAAKAAEAAVTAGRELGPLHGVPVSIKDVQAVAGLPTRRGSLTSPSEPAPEDAPAVARLRAAGAIILGKTTTTEQGWTATSENPVSGATENPWAPGVTSGGSSSGAAVLAATGCCPLNLGTDGAGSVRIPAHFCGVVGFKPTFGRVPYLPVPNNNGLSHIGPLARSAEDAALMYGVMAGYHPADPMSLTDAVAIPELAAASVKGLRVAFSPALGHARVDPGVAAAVAGAAKAFAELGAHVEAHDPAWGPTGPEVIGPLWGAAMLATTSAEPAAVGRIDPGLAACLADSRALTLAEVTAAQARRFAYASEVGRWFAGGWDLLLTPAASVTAFPLGRQRPAHWEPHPWNWLTWAEFSYPFNLAHAPAVSVPCGLVDGLPVGLQIVGPRGADARVLAAARAFSMARPFAALPPLDS